VRRAGEVLKGNRYAWDVKLGWFSLTGRIQIDSNVSDTRILFSTYPVFLVRAGYVSKAYPTRIRVQHVSDTGYGPLLEYPRIIGQHQQSPRTTTASIYPLPLAVSPAVAPFLLLLLELGLPLPLVDRSPSPIPHPFQNKTRLGPVPSCIAELRRRFGRRLLRCAALPCIDECRRPQHSLI
jgi:hypothetical protein